MTKLPYVKPNMTMNQGKEPFIAPRFQILSGSALKVIALVAMLIDHIGLWLIPSNAYVLFSVFGKQITLYWLMRVIGRLAFPIFAFLIVEGAIYTHNRLRYGLNLFVFALLSEVPWDLLHFNSLFNMAKQNVFFTLLLGYLGICLYEKLQGKWWLQAGALVALFGATYFVRADYGVRGFVFILMVYALHEHRVVQALITATGLLRSSFLPALAYFPLMFYNGKRGFIKGKVFKYAFYAFYPVHLLVLFFIKKYL